MGKALRRLSTIVLLCSLVAMGLCLVGQVQATWCYESPTHYAMSINCLYSCPGANAPCAGLT
jgi:hypothetical protein